MTPRKAIPVMKLTPKSTDTVLFKNSLGGMMASMALLSTHIRRPMRTAATQNKEMITGEFHA